MSLNKTKRLRWNSKETQRVFGKALISLSEAFLILFHRIWSILQFLQGMKAQHSPMDQIIWPKNSWNTQERPLVCYHFVKLSSLSLLLYICFWARGCLEQLSGTELISSLKIGIHPLLCQFPGTFLVVLTLKWGTWPELHLPAEARN